MNLKRIFSLTLILWALVAFVIPVSASAADNTDDLSVYFRPAIRFGTDDRVLYILDFLVPVYRGNKSLLFVNAKFTPDNHHAWETNFGVGYRRLVMDDRLVLGGNLFYDHRKTRYNSHFDQVGLGFEAMAEPGGIGLTGRFNYYQPLTRAKLGDDFGYAFYGNGIYTAGIEEAMTGFDYEAGVRIPGISNYVETWAYAGGYHYFGCHVPDVNGFSARIEAFPTDFLRLDFEYRNDTVNNDEFYGEVAFEVPFSIDNLVAGKNPFEGIGDVLTGSRTLKERMVEPVHRDVDIVVGKDYLTGSDAVRYGTFMEGVIFVADNADTGGDGSYEHPYNNLSLANGDARLGDTISIVHVLTGDGTGLAGEFFTQAGITIWGAGANNPAYPNVANLVQGYPLITSTLTMDGQDQTILGLYFSNPGTHGIYVGPGAGGSAFSIFSNVIENASWYGIYYDAGSIGADGSPVVIRNNEIYSADVVYVAGIYLSSDGDVYTRILNNEIRSDWGSFGISIETFSGDFFGEVSGNRIDGLRAYGSGLASGISLNIHGELTGTVSNNDISNIYSDVESVGISAWADRFSGSIIENRISAVYTDGGSGDYASASGIYAGGNDDFTGSIAGNTITDIEAYDGEYTYAYGIYGWTNSDFAGSVTDNRITDVWADYGYYQTEACGIYTYANGNYTGSISGNAVDSVWAEENYNGGYNAAFGILAEAYNAGEFNGSITDNRISDIGAYDGEYAYAGGIAVNFTQWWHDSGTGSFNGTISGNTVAGISSEYADTAKTFGIFGYVSGGDLGGSITDNRIGNLEATDADSAGAYGIYLNAEGSSSSGGPIACVVSGNTINGLLAYDADGASAYGIFTRTYYGDFTGSIFGNTISGINVYDGDSFTDACGIFGYVYNGGLSGRIDGNKISDFSNEGSPTGIMFFVNGGDLIGSISNNTITGLRSVNDMAVGVDLTTINGSFTGTVSGNTIRSITGYFARGIGVQGELGLAGTITGNTITGVSAATVAYGIYLDTDGDLTASITDNVMLVNAGDGGVGLIAYAYYGSFGTLSSPMLFTGNTGSIDAPTAYLACLYTNYPDSSNVFIGHTRNINNFTTTGAWNGNYPYVGGRIWASDNGSFINR